METNEVKASPCVVTKVNALIANKLTAYNEEDRGWLEKMDLPQLEKMDVQAPAPIETNSSTVQVLTDEQKRDLAWAKNERLARRNSMIGVIQANTSKEIWPDATLAAMDEDTLGRVFSSVKKEEETADYSMNLNTQSSIQDNSKEEILLPTGITLDK